MAFVMRRRWALVAVLAVLALVTLEIRAEELTGVDLRNNGQTVVAMTPQGTSLYFPGFGLPDQILTRVEYLSYRTLLKPLRAISASMSVSCDPASTNCEPMSCLCPNHEVIGSTVYCSCLSVLYDSTATDNVINCYLGQYAPDQTVLSNVQPCVSPAPPVNTIPKTPNIDFTVLWDTWTVTTPTASTPTPYYPAGARYRSPGGNEVQFYPGVGATFSSPNQGEMGWSSILALHNQATPLLIKSIFYPNVTTPVYFDEWLLYTPYAIYWSNIYNPFAQIFRRPKVTLSVVAPNGRTYVHPQQLANSDQFLNLRISRFLPSINCRVVLDVTDETGRSWSGVSSPVQIQASKAVN